MELFCKTREENPCLAQIFLDSRGHHANVVRQSKARTRIRSGAIL